MSQASNHIHIVYWYTKAGLTWEVYIYAVYTVRDIGGVRGSKQSEQRRRVKSRTVERCVNRFALEWGVDWNTYGNKNSRQGAKAVL